MRERRGSRSRGRGRLHLVHPGVSQQSAESVATTRMEKRQFIWRSRCYLASINWKGLRLRGAVVSDIEASSSDGHTSPRPTTSPACGFAAARTAVGSRAGPRRPGPRRGGRPKRERAGVPVPAASKRRRAGLRGRGGFAAWQASAAWLPFCGAVVPGLHSCECGRAELG
jgi:hypothetical protein